MRAIYVVLLAAVVLSLRFALFRRRRAQGVTAESRPVQHVAPPARARSWPGLGLLGDVGIVAQREIQERIRGRIFRVGTLIMLAAVAAAIVIPRFDHSSNGPTQQTVGLVGHVSAETKQLLETAGKENHDSVKLVPEPTLGSAKAQLRSGTLDLAVVDGEEVLLNEPAADSSSPADPSLVETVAEYLGVLKAYQVAGLTPAQSAQVTQARAVPVHTLQQNSKGAEKGVSVVGIVLLFLLLQQYCTWILIGVMQEKSSRVVEVLLAAVRPIQLLTGKVLGIGLVAVGQAAVVVGFALGLSAAVGSDLLRGTGPVELLAELLWFVLGYAFYCWMYAAAGSMAERQDQVQTLALPLSIPILVGYIFSITVASSGSPDLLFKVLAYLPPTAPFCMSVLVGLSDVSWWQFLASVLISLAGTFAMARVAALIYRRAVLRTGGRVRIRELLAQGAR